MTTAANRGGTGGAPGAEDPFERRIAFSLAAAMTVGGAVVLAVALYASQWIRAANLAMIIAFGAMGGALLLRRGNKAGYLVLISGAWLGAAGGSTLGGGLAAPIAAAFPVLLFFAAWIDRRAVLVFAAASVALFAAFAHLASEGLLPEPPARTPYEALVVYLVVLSGSAAIAYYVSMSQRLRMERLRQSRRALALSEERFRHLTRLSSDWYWEQDQELRFVSTVGEDDERGGILAVEHIGKQRWELPGTDILGQSWDEHRKILAERKPFRDLLLKRTGSDGTVHYVSVAGEPYYDETGAYAGYRGVASDVTQRVRATQEARAADERLRQAIESLNEAVALTDAEDRIVVTNRAFRELNGNTGLDSPGRLYEEHLRHGISIGNYPDAIGREDAWLKERLERRRRGGIAEVRRQNGRWLLVTDQALPDGGTITFGLDITQRKAAEEELKASRRLLEQVIDAIPMSIFAKDLDSNYVMVNRYMAEFFGSTKEALFKRHTSQLPSQEATRQQSLRDDRWVYENRRPLVHETWIQKPDGTPVPYHSSKIPLFDASGHLTGLLGINRDITAERQARREIEEINASLEARVRERTAQLESANRELEAFSYSVSHDLKAPLRAIDGAAGIMKMKFGAQLPAGAEPYLARISQSARRMGVLIEGLLEFARLSRQALRRDPVQPEEIVRAVLHGAEAAIQERGAVVKLGALPPCSADALLLRQVYENLVSNALKYSAQARPPTIEIGAKREGADVVYYVRDNGVGFEMDYANKLFGVFQRLHAPEHFEGTGIGLALARRIIERHGGRIWAESAPGSGATFYFTIGSVDATATADAERSAA